MTQTSINTVKFLYELSIPKEAVEVSRRILEEVGELSVVLESPVVTLAEKERVIERIFPPGDEEFSLYSLQICTCLASAGNFSGISGLL